MNYVHYLGLWRSCKSEYLEKLFNFWFTVEDGITAEGHLSKETTHCPHIYFKRVVLFSEKELGRSVPESSGLSAWSFSFFRVFGSVWEVRDLDNSWEGEIGELYLVVFSDKNIIGFEIPVHYAISVAVSQTLQNLIENVLNILKGHRGSLLLRLLSKSEAILKWNNLILFLPHIFFKVILMKFVNKLSQFIFHFSMFNFSHIWMWNALQVRNFPQDASRESIVLSRISHIQKYLSQCLLFLSNSVESHIKLSFRPSFNEALENLESLIDLKGLHFIQESPYLGVLSVFEPVLVEELDFVD